MAAKPRFLISLALAMLAICLHATSLSQFGRATRITAQKLTAAEPQRAALESQAAGSISHGSVLDYFAQAVALASVVMVVASARKHEPARRSVTLALLLVYVLIQFVWV